MLILIFNSCHAQCIQAEGIYTKNYKSKKDTNQSNSSYYEAYASSQKANIVLSISIIYKKKSNFTTKLTSIKMQQNNSACTVYVQVKQYEG